MKPHTTPTLPGRVDSSMLLKHLQDGEPVVIIKLIGVGNSAPYDFRDKGTRSYVFRWENAYGGHIVRIPLSLWQANKGQMAHDIMDQRRMSHSMIVLLEMPPVITKYEGPSTKEQTISKPQEAPAIPETAAPANTPVEMVAADTSESVRNVVGPDVEPTAATAEEQEEKTTYSTEDEQDEAERRYRESLPTTAETPSDKAQSTDGSQHVVQVGKPLFEAAYDLVEPPKRIKALAALLGVEEAPLREAIALPDSKVELANAGWVRRKA